MEPTRASYFLLRKHMLYYDAPRQAVHHDVAAVAPGATTQGTPSPQLKRSHSVAGPDNFIKMHISFVKRYNESATIDTPPPGSPGRAPPFGRATRTPEAIAAELEAALAHVQTAHQRFPAPQLTLLELIPAFLLHMSFHRVQGHGGVSGEYIVSALANFFGVGLHDAFHRYVVALIECDCIVTKPDTPLSVFVANSFRVQSPGGINSGADRSFFHNKLSSRNQQRAMHKYFDAREVLSRLVSLFTFDAGHESTELFYLSHVRSLMQGPPHEDQKDADETRSAYPESLRRQTFGPIANMISACVQQLGPHGVADDQCAIVRLIGVKIVVAQLCPSNNSNPIISAESKKYYRDMCPVHLVFGVPERYPDNLIQTNVKKMLDALESTEGCRRTLGYNKTPDEFRLYCRSLGAKLYSLIAVLFFRPEAPESAFSKLNGRVNAATPTKGGGSSDVATVCNLSPLLDHGVEQFTAIAKGTTSRRSCSGFPTMPPFALQYRTSTHTLARRTCSLATQLLISLRGACSSFGGCLASSLFFHGNVVLSDAHPYLSALLGVRTRLVYCQESPLQDTDELSREGILQQATTEVSESLWTDAPVRDQCPFGPFRDAHFGEPSMSFGGGGGSSSGCPVGPRSATPQTQSGRMESNVSPTTWQNPSSPTGGRSPVPSDSAATDSGAANVLRPHLFDPMPFHVSHELAAIIPTIQDKSLPISPGLYTTIQLSCGGVDAVVMLPLDATVLTAAEREHLKDFFFRELRHMAMDMHTLRRYILAVDSVPREADTSASGAVDASGSGSGGDTPSNSASSHASSVAPTAAASSKGGDPSFQTLPLCAIHDLALGVVEFIDGPLGSQDDKPASLRQTPTTALLNRGTVFLEESNVLATLLGAPLRTPRMYMDDHASADFPFAVEPTTRVLLGRSAFQEKDRKGAHSVLYARQSGGQQVYFGAPSVHCTLRNVEDLLLNKMNTSTAHTAVV